MRAIRFHRTGGPEVLTVDEVPPPEPGRGEVRVRVRHAGVNYIDTYLRTGSYDPGPLPAIAGREGAGVVETVGAGVAEIREGDRVAFFDARGSYAETVVLPAARAIPVPSGLEDVQAAALPLQGMTARYLTRVIRPIAAGDTVLIHAAAGGVGHLAVQLAKRAGAFVFGTCSTDAKAAFVRSLGADVVLRYDQGAFADAILEQTDGRGVDLAFDGVGRATFAGTVRATRIRGHVILFGQSSGSPDPIDPRRFLGSRTLTTATLFDYTKTPDELRELAAPLFSLAEVGGIRARIASVTQAMRTLNDEPLTEALRGLRVPTLIVVGEKDFLGAGGSVILSRTIPDSVLEIVAGRGHGIYLEAPEWFAERVAEFLEERTAGI